MRAKNHSEERERERIITSFVQALLEEEMVAALAVVINPRGLGLSATWMLDKIQYPCNGPWLLHKQQGWPRQMKMKTCLVSSSVCLAARSAQCVAFVPLAKRWPLRNWVNVMPNGYSAAPSPIKLAMIPLFGKLNRVMAATSQTSWLQNGRSGGAFKDTWTFSSTSTHPSILTFHSTLSYRTWIKSHQNQS